MSYILEALKKSQQERELGLEPALPADTPAVGRGGPALGRHVWGYVSLALAAAAIMISVYGLVQGRFSAPPGAPDSVPGEVSSAPANVGHRPSASGSPPAPAPSPAVAASSDQVPEPSSGGAVAEAPIRSDPEPAPAQASTPAPEALAPERPASPRMDPGSGGAAAPGLAQARSGGVVEAANGARLAAPTETVPTPTSGRELPRVRQPAPKRAETAAARPAPAHALPVAPPGSMVGASAARQAKQGRVPELAAAVERRIEAAPAPATARESDVDRAPVHPPRKLPPGPSQLPAAVFRELPEARVLVHVYVEQPGQRFVILNSRKLREGDSSPEGLRMEEIVPEGVVLSFKGHQFFIPR